ncbi:hypothetical protein IWQ62_003774 [Dispira parvispora]|uniref:Derlin n=1 Tax=Dispira parvispora TaxID=1520584 RepID=A0A9W8AR51_9FUNG|nr:hypothetical protein IWQ62_003774 [Dispira parvispora]
MDDSPLEQLKTWYNRVPIVTRMLLTMCISSTLLVTLTNTLGWALFSWIAIVHGQYWRLISGLIAQRMSLGFVVDMYMLSRFSGMLENDVFNNRRADFVFFYMFAAASMVLFAVFQQSHLLLFRGVFMAMLYLWSRLYPQYPLQFFFGIRFQGAYLPWALLAMEFVSSGSVSFLSLMGIVTGHLFHYLAVETAQGSQAPLLTTPAWMRRLVGSGAAPTPNPTRGLRGQPAQQRTAHPWGQGYRLG